MLLEPEPPSCQRLLVLLVVFLLVAFLLVVFLLVVFLLLGSDVFLLSLGGELELDLNLRGDDVVEGVCTLGETLLLATYLGDADLVVTTEGAVLGLFHTVGEEFHGLALEDLAGLAADDLLAVLVNVGVSGVRGAQVGVVAQLGLSGVGSLDLGDAEGLDHLGLLLLSLFSALLHLADVLFRLLADGA